MVMDAEERREMFVESVPESVFAARERRVIATLRATRPGRRSRRICALAMESALFDGGEMKRAVRAIMAAPTARPWAIPGPPPEPVVRRLRPYTCRPIHPREERSA